MSDTKKFRITLSTVSGETFTSDEDEATDTDLAKIENWFSDFRFLDYLALTIDDRKTFINPAHIVAATVVVIKED